MLEHSLIPKGHLPNQTEDVLYWSIEINNDDLYSLPTRNGYINVTGHDLLILGISLDVIQSGDCIRVIREGAWRALNEQLIATRIGINMTCLQLLSGREVRVETYGRYKIHILQVNEQYGYYIEDVITNEIVNWRITTSSCVHDCLSHGYEFINPRRIA